MPYTMSQVSSGFVVGPQVGGADFVSLASMTRGTKVGQKVTFFGEVRSGGAQGTPVAGAKITLRMYTSPLHWPDEWANLGDKGYTDAQGKFAFTWDVPIDVVHYLVHYKLSCNDWAFKVQVDGSTLWSNEMKIFVSYSTRISNFIVPSTVQVGETFSVSGTLEYEDLPGIWFPLASKSVKLTYGANTFGTATTNILGGFQVTGSISDKGEYNMIAEFSGANFPSQIFRLGGLNVSTALVTSPIIPLLLGLLGIYIYKKKRG